MTDDARRADAAPNAGVVLVVEDDADFAKRIVGRHFRRDFNVQFAYNIPQAHAALDEIVDLILAIIDLELPGGAPFGSTRGGGGFELVERARSQFPRAHVVVLTGHIHPRLVNTAHRLGANFISKSGCDDNLRALSRVALAARRGVYDRPAAFVQRFVNPEVVTSEGGRDRWSFRYGGAGALEAYSLRALVVVEYHGSA